MGISQRPCHEHVACRATNPDVGMNKQGGGSRKSKRGEDKSIDKEDRSRLEDDGSNLLTSCADSVLRVCVCLAEAGDI